MKNVLFIVGDDYLFLRLYMTPLQIQNRKSEFIYCQNVIRKQCDVNTTNKNMDSIFYKLAEIELRLLFMFFKILRKLVEINDLAT